MERLRVSYRSSLPMCSLRLPRRDQRRWGACYLRGLMLDGRRKSIQPMAERLPDGNMQALQQFVNQSPWDWLPVRRRIAERLCEAVGPEVWVVDYVSFPKCGTASVGVALAVLRSVGEAGELPGCGQRPRRHRHRVMPAGVAAVPARRVGARRPAAAAGRDTRRGRACVQDPAGSGAAGPAGLAGPEGARDRGRCRLRTQRLLPARAGRARLVLCHGRRPEGGRTARRRQAVSARLRRPGAADPGPIPRGAPPAAGPP
ncbi:hypothetical protein SCANM63S_05396 [Streptomyces canarius]